MRSAKGVAEGIENSTYLIDTDGGQAVLTLYEKRVAAADLPYFVALADHLQDGPVPVPAVLRTGSGEAIRTLMGRPACLYRFHPGLSPTRPTRTQARAAGEALGDLHRRLADFSGDRPNAMGHRTWPALAAGLAGALDGIEAGLEAVVAGALRAAGGLARRPADGRDPRRPVPGQRADAGRPGDGRDRLDLRLHGRARLRPGRGARGLVLRRARGSGSTPPSARRWWRATRRCGHWSRASGRRCRCWLRARRCGSC